MCSYNSLLKATALQCMQYQGHSPYFLLLLYNRHMFILLNKFSTTHTIVPCLLKYAISILS